MEISYEPKIIEVNPVMTFQVIDSTGNSTEENPFDASVISLSPDTISIPSGGMFKLTYLPRFMPVELISTTASSPLSLQQIREDANFGYSYMLIDGVVVASHDFAEGRELMRENLMPYGIYLENGMEITATVRRQKTGSSYLGEYEVKLRSQLFGILERQS